MSDETCICIDLRTASNRLTRLYDEAMAPSGISVTQFSQLHLIRSLDGPTLKELASASGLDRSTLGRNIRVLERMGLVTMETGSDARTRAINITRKGTSAFRKAFPLWNGVQRQLINRLGEPRRAELKSLLNELSGVNA